jgi:hypothetical protein
VGDKRICIITSCIGAANLEKDFKISQTFPYFSTPNL